MADASAVFRIMSRRGLGKVCNFNTNRFWTQEASANRRVKSEKAAGSTNPADLLAKEPSSSVIEKYNEMMGGVFAGWGT